MRIRSLSISLFWIGLLAVLAMVGGTAALAKAPLVGAPAPAFAFVDEAGISRNSADFFSADRKHPDRGVVIAWFPKAFTPG